MGLRPAWANAGGYLIGWTASFILARNYVFGNNQSWTSTGPRYVTAALGAFLANQTVLEIATRVANHLVIAQLVAVTVYTISLFFACRFWVFRPAQSDRAG